MGDNMTCSYSVIIDDDIYEGQEDFFLDLNIALTFQALRILEGSPVRATVQIEDEDGEIDCFTSDQVYC